MTSIVGGALIAASLEAMLEMVVSADALFDEINTEALRCKVETNQKLGLKSGVSNNLKSLTSNLQVPKILNGGHKRFAWVAKLFHLVL
ncbi:hypothetical protein TSUD_321580 [Trifolium subterraneum]|uniref:Uncharacterized protein n=1 Tax=Trifolium subterraneum TaxID=3900 RepID=A0A2Z6P8X3_TRISU|nr:hypothetical protein TSUD_321580 [Trifolium subterraneum]